MKFHFIKAFLFPALLLSVTLTSCLKDPLYDNHQAQAFSGGTTQVISLGINVLSSGNFSPFPINNLFVDTTLNFVPVELGGPNAASQDIQVTIDTSAALIDSLNNYNNTNGGTSDYFFPDSVTILNPVVTIKAGTRIGYLQVKFTAHKYIGQDVALGFKIISVSPSNYTISGNYGTGIVAIVVKNFMDGKYILREYMEGWAAYNIASGVTNQWPSQIVFATTGTASNLIVTNENGSAQAGFSPSGSILGFGAATPQYNFDPITFKLISIDNLTPDGRNRHFTPIPADNSRYDPVTKTIYISYFMDQNGRPPQTIKDTLFYQGPR